MKWWRDRERPAGIHIDPIWRLGTDRPKWGSEVWGSELLAWLVVAVLLTAAVLTLTGLLRW